MNRVKLLVRARSCSRVDGRRPCGCGVSPVGQRGLRVPSAAEIDCKVALELAIRGFLLEEALVIKLKVNFRECILVRFNELISAVLALQRLAFIDVVKPFGLTA